MGLISLGFFLLDTHANAQLSSNEECRTEQSSINKDSPDADPESLSRAACVYIIILFVWPDYRQKR